MKTTNQIRLIHGAFSVADALELVTKMIHIKIDHHDRKIDGNSSEEDIKYRETKIKQLQNELFQLRAGLDPHVKTIKLDATIDLSAQ